MKLICIILITFLIWSSSITAQQKQWQWIKQGGASSTTDNTIDPEEVYDIATDSDRNVYVVSPIGYLNPQIDGHQKNYYGGGNDVMPSQVLPVMAVTGGPRSLAEEDMNLPPILRPTITTIFIWQGALTVVMGRIIHFE